jgi:cell division protein ZapA (FtsZ GTPase activity inhibitor)
MAPAPTSSSALRFTAPSVRRALAAIRSHHVPADQIDHAILAAINVTLCLLSGCNDRVAEGFNRDLAVSGGRVP